MKRIGIVFCVLLVCSVKLQAGDWPQWRYDAGRGAATPDDLPVELFLSWVRQLPEPRPAWPASQPWLRFDLSYSPVAAEGLLYVPSMVTDSVTAYDTDTGAERWRFYADGPVRLAPIVHAGRVYFGSDDGFLYCLDAAEGRLVWKFRGGPSDRKVLGNERLISTWPVRGGPVLLQGKIYFSAGIWPFMGIFIHAVDAQSGEPLWTNSGYSTTYTVQPHSSPAFASLVPRGHFAATQQGLVAPGGRTEPGRFDLDTGKLLGFTFGGKSSGSHHVTALRDWYFVGGSMCNIVDGQTLLSTQAAIHDDNTVYSLEANQIAARALEIEEQKTDATDRKGKKTQVTKRSLNELWKCSLPEAAGRLFLKAGSRFYTGAEGQVAAIEVDTEDQKAEIVWKGTIDGTPWTMLAADEKLFVVTTDGRIYCFGATKSTPAAPIPRAARTAKPFGSGAAGGYCLMFGLDAKQTASWLAEEPTPHVVVIDPDQAKVDAFRRRSDDAGLYGGRVAAHVGDPATFPLPPYIASRIHVDDSLAARAGQDTTIVEAVFGALRPFGGTASLPLDADRLEILVERARLEGAEVSSLGSSRAKLARVGPLPGAADWTHHYADPANSIVSKDQRVKAPLGLLWFGGPPNDEVLPRHGHGPSPQVAGGRLFIEGGNMLRALDAYTGRLLWQKDLPNLGEFHDHTGHQPGAGEIGGNYVSLEDRVYVVYGDAILDLDAATGNVRRQFKVKAPPDHPEPSWGFLAAHQDLLVATSTPVAPPASESTKKPDFPAGLVALIKPNESWHYLAGADPEGDWTAPDYNAKNWKTGPAGFGYGDGDDQTRLDMRNRYGRVYVRKRFDAKPADAAKLSLFINYDDAFIAYLNGKEVVRAGVGSGSGPKAAGIEGHEAEGFELFAIDDFQELLRPGENVIAIEGHNGGLTSSDFSLDPALLVAKSAGGSTEAVEEPPPPALHDVLAPTRYASASRRLVVFNRHTGRELWQRQATYAFRHNNIAVGAEKLFLIDGLSRAKQETLKRRGVDLGDYKPRLLALDLHTGDETWSTSENVFGTFLNYSEEHDVLLQAGSAYRDRARDEADTGMVAYRGRDGTVLWKNLALKHAGPCMLHHDAIITQGPAYSLLTGQPKIRKHPLSGEPLPWQFTRNYGCNTAVASEHLITFRSAAAGYYDLAGDGGTGNFGGFKSSCTANLIVAGGLLNAPEYTRTCECRYQNQTSLALHHDPDVETWTFNALAWDGKPVRRVGINFGAPGDRRTDDGTLWMDYPSQGGPSPDLPVDLKIEDVEYFRHHSSLVREAPGGQGLPWVAASGLQGAGRVTITLTKEESPPRRNYTVRLHFAEMEGAEPGRRAFRVALQGKSVLAKLDIAAETGLMTALVKEFTGVEVTDKLEIDLAPLPAATSAPPILCGLEIVAEGW